MSIKKIITSTTTDSAILDATPLFLLFSANGWVFSIWDTATAVSDISTDEAEATESAARNVARTVRTVRDVSRPLRVVTLSMITQLAN